MEAIDQREIVNTALAVNKLYPELARFEYLTPTGVKSEDLQSTQMNGVGTISVDDRFINPSPFLRASSLTSFFVDEPGHGVAQLHDALSGSALSRLIPKPWATFPNLSTARIAVVVYDEQDIEAVEKWASVPEDNEFAYEYGTVDLSLFLEGGTPEINLAALRRLEHVLTRHVTYLELTLKNAADPLPADETGGILLDLIDKFTNERFVGVGFELRLGAESTSDQEAFLDVITSELQEKYPGLSVDKSEVDVDGEVQFLAYAV